MKKQIPNLITLLNLFCGCLAVLFAVHGLFEMVALFVFLGIFFDFFDGFAARMLKVQSELGLQLDSLADMVTSGVVPGIVMYKLLLMSTTGGWSSAMFAGVENNFYTSGFQISSIIPFIGFVITLASSYRLAKFNIDENQTESFIGLPTPANALLIISLPLILAYQNFPLLSDVILNQWFLLAVTALSAYLLNANLPLFALKFKTWNFKDNAIRYIFLILCVVLLITLKYLAVPIIIVTYILLSVVSKLGTK
ncbi:CDP-alcohol phosphatidyltransferase family protein [Cellulophaga lytica]|uniref:CDP-alcohol phosphatidyltransferase family protein n=1 Tax=Cellulophaga lytica TaxID=979 RepID=UPI000B5C8C7A|nr:CDP-alcohol phosphatidyltransferase family protein [Cellulophaga lytica]SNQ43985.1 phosphatidylserine synthase [Cellulophaga lytica]